jgi:Kef-type K+ transport system membrane component KefB
MAGAIVLGLAVPEGPPLGSELVNQLELFSSWILTPIFVTCCVMKVNLTMCGPPILIVVISGFIILVHTIKLFECVIVCKYCNMPSSDGLCLALILSCKGVIDTCSFILVYDGMVSKGIVYIYVIDQIHQILLSLKGFGDYYINMSN